MWIELAFVGILSACVSILFMEMRSRRLESGVVELLTEAREGINQQFAEFQPLIKRYYTMIGEKGHDSQDLERGKKMIVSDVLKMDPLLEAGLDFLSPKTREWIDEHPDQAIELIPSLQKLWAQLQGQDLTASARKSKRLYPSEV